MKRALTWFALVAAICWLSAGCTDEDGARNALRSAGMKQITFTGYDWFACSKDDFSCTGFEATNADGSRVRGAVGCGFWLKACTVRFQ